MENSYNTKQGGLILSLLQKKPGRHFTADLKCSGCGRLIHVECGYLDELAQHVLEHHGFVISPEKTVLYGLCDKCREALDEE